MERADNFLRNGERQEGSNSSFRRGKDLPLRPGLNGDLDPNIWSDPEVDKELDYLRLYLNEVGKHPLLTPEKEKDVAQTKFNGQVAFFTLRYFIKMDKLSEALRERVEERLKELFKAEEAEEFLSVFYNRDNTSSSKKKRSLYSVAVTGKRIVAPIVLAKRRANKNLKELEKLKRIKGKDVRESRVRDFVDGQISLVEDGQKSLEILINSNLRLPASVAKKNNGWGLDILDLIQEENQGLMRAANKFDYRMEDRFSTYAMWWIRQAKRRTIMDKSRTIRAPEYAQERAINVDRIKEQYYLENGRQPSREEIRAIVNGQFSVNFEGIEKIHQTDNVLSLEMQVGSEEDNTLGNLLEDPDVNIEDSVENLGLVQQIHRVLYCLTTRERKVVILRFGIGDNRGRTLEEVGRALGVTRERARQIEAQALGKMRRLPEVNQLRGNGNDASKL